MKYLPLTLTILFGAIAPLLLFSPSAHAQLGKTTKKVAIRGRVLQVLPEGLLMSGGGNPYLLAGYPGAKDMADGDAVNCYAEKTEHTFKYEDTTGAMRTVRVWRFLNGRIGK